MNDRLSATAHSAASRARWLADLAAALNGAGLLALRLSEGRPAGRDEIALLAQIRKLQAEVASIRRAGRFVTFHSSETDALIR